MIAACHSLSCLKPLQQGRRDRLPECAQNALVFETVPAQMRDQFPHLLRIRRKPHFLTIFVNVARERGFASQFGPGPFQGLFDNLLPDVPAKQGLPDFGWTPPVVRHPPESEIIRIIGII
jgi:hypothetical protein